MYQCDVNEIPCNENDYDRFDSVCKKELASPITVDEVINQSDFCTFLAIDIIEESNEDDDISINEHLSNLKGKMGVYQLWIDVGYCQDHDTYSMLCVYVGKGQADKRVLSHIKEKWPNEEMLYVSFFECNNRIAKYLEQLFLDTYKFHLNKDENNGTDSLYARWDEDRHDIGTELQTHADIRAYKMSSE